MSVYGLYDVNQISDVSCSFIHSEFTLIGNFTTSDATLNQIQHNLQWSILSNMISVPSDCPSRDERRGYGGDASLSIDAALFNFDMVRYYDSWLYQWEVAQDDTGTLPIVAPGGSGPPDPNWETIAATATWTLYDHYGYIGILQRHYPLVRNWVDFCWAQYNQTGLAQFFGYIGDWVRERTIAHMRRQRIPLTFH